MQCTRCNKEASDTYLEIPICADCKTYLIGQESRYQCISCKIFATKSVDFDYTRSLCKNCQTFMYRGSSLRSLLTEPIPNHMLRHSLRPLASDPLSSIRKLSKNPANAWQTFIELIPLPGEMYRKVKCPAGPCPTKICGICKKPTLNRGNVCIVKCGHFFHIHCIAYKQNEAAQKEKNFFCPCSSCEWSGSQWTWRNLDNSPFYKMPEDLFIKYIGN